MTEYQEVEIIGPTRGEVVKKLRQEMRRGTVAGTQEMRQIKSGELAGMWALPMLRMPGRARPLWRRWAAEGVGLVLLAGFAWWAVLDLNAWALAGLLMTVLVMTVDAIQRALSVAEATILPRGQR